jgi:hypothetical protein
MNVSSDASWDLSRPEIASRLGVDMSTVFQVKRFQEGNGGGLGWKIGVEVECAEPVLVEMREKGVAVFTREGKLEKGVVLAYYKGMDPSMPKRALRMKGLERRPLEMAQAAADLFVKGRKDSAKFQVAQIWNEWALVCPKESMEGLRGKSVRDASVGVEVCLTDVPQWLWKNPRATLGNRGAKKSQGNENRGGTATSSQAKQEKPADLPQQKTRVMDDFFGLGEGKGKAGTGGGNAWFAKEEAATVAAKSGAEPQSPSNVAAAAPVARSAGSISEAMQEIERCASAMQAKVEEVKELKAVMASLESMVGQMVDNAEHNRGVEMAEMQRRHAEERELARLESERATTAMAEAEKMASEMSGDVEKWTREQEAVERRKVLLQQQVRKAADEQKKKDVKEADERLAKTEKERKEKELAGLVKEREQFEEKKKRDAAKAEEVRRADEKQEEMRVEQARRALEEKLAADCEELHKKMEETTELEGVDKELEKERTAKAMREKEDERCGQRVASGKGKKENAVRKADKARQKVEADEKTEANKEKKKAERRDREKVAAEKVKTATGHAELTPGQMEEAEAAVMEEAEDGKDKKKTRTKWTKEKRLTREEVAAGVVGDQTYTEVRFELVETVKTEQGVGIRRVAKHEHYLTDWFEVADGGSRKLVRAAVEADDWARVMTQSGMEIPYETGGPLFEGGPDVCVVRKSWAEKKERLPYNSGGEWSVLDTAWLVKAVVGERMDTSDEGKAAPGYYFRVDWVKKSKPSND